MLKHKGWTIVGAAFIADFIAVGFFFYSYGVFFKAIANELESSRFSVSLGLTLTSMTAGLAAPLIGHALDKYSIKTIMLIGGFLTGLSFLLLSTITALWHLYVITGLMTALGVSMLGGLSSAKLVTNWFYSKRGLALGVAAMGISLSGVIMPPTATWIIEQWGWRYGFIFYSSFIICIVLPVLALIVVNRPEQSGVRAYGAPVNEQTNLVDSDYNAKKLMQNSAFWIITLSFALIISILSAVLTHLIPYLTDQGISSIESAVILSACAASGVIGKVSFGYSIDKWPPIRVITMAILIQLIGLMGIVTTSEYQLTLLSAVIFGFGMGGSIPLHGALVGKFFHHEAFGRVMGLMRPLMLPLQLLGLPFAGWAFDQWGSYNIAFYTFLIIYILAIYIINQLKCDVTTKKVDNTN